MDIAVSRLDGETYAPSEFSPALAESLFLTCSICGKSVFPIWGKKQKHHFRHYHNESIDCDLYHGGGKSNNDSRSFGQSKSHPPILQKMLSQKFYSLVFEHTYFPERGDSILEHLGNALVTKSRGAVTGKKAVAGYGNPDCRAFLVLPTRLTHVGAYWDLNDLTELIRSSFTPRTGLIAWGSLVDTEMAHYQVARAEKLQAEDFVVAAIAEAVIQACQEIKDRANPKVLQLIIGFLMQKRQFPILKELVLLAYANSIFPKDEATAATAYRSGWTQCKPSNLSVNQFFAELMGLYLIRLLISVPWIEFANQYHKNGVVKPTNSILVPQLLIPGIIVQLV
jgi:hypothetical protein